MATPKEIFETALSLRDKEELTIPFEHKSQQNSVRVALYRAKESFGEEGSEISISQRDDCLILTRGKRRGYNNSDLTFSISKIQDPVDTGISISHSQTTSKKVKPGQVEVDSLEKERLELHEKMRAIVLAFPNERVAQEEINNPESEIFSLQTKLDLLVKRIKSLRDLYEIPIVRVSATEEEYLRFEKEFQDEQEKERIAAEALANSLEC